MKNKIFYINSHYYSQNTQIPFHTLVTRCLIIDAATLSSCTTGAWSTSIRYEIVFPWLPNFSRSRFVGLPFGLRYSVLRNLRSCPEIPAAFPTFTQPYSLLPDLLCGTSNLFTKISSRSGGISHKLRSANKHISIMAR